MLELNEQRQADLLEALATLRWMVRKMTKAGPKRVPSIVESNTIGRIIQTMTLAKKAVEPYEGWKEE